MKLAVIVPYRNREEHLIKFIPYITNYLSNQIKEYKIELIEKGFNNAFVVAFLNGERISIEKAIKLAEK